MLGQNKTTKRRLSIECELAYLQICSHKKNIPRISRGKYSAIFIYFFKVFGNLWIFKHHDNIALLSLKIYWRVLDIRKNFYPKHVKLLTSSAKFQNFNGTETSISRNKNFLIIKFCKKYSNWCSSFQLWNKNIFCNQSLKTWISKN